MSRWPSSLSSAPADTGRRGAVAQAGRAPEPACDRAPSPPLTFPTADETCARIMNIGTLEELDGRWNIERAHGGPRQVVRVALELRARELIEQLRAKVPAK